MHILNLSDLHISADTDIDTLFATVQEDLHSELKVDRLAGIILAGDVANRASAEEYAGARRFLDKLTAGFHVPPEYVVVVPGNHDVSWARSQRAFTRQRRSNALMQKVRADELHVHALSDRGGIMVAEPRLYRTRFTPFAAFYEHATARRYSLAYEDQFSINVFPPLGLLVIALNSAWCLDHYRPGRPGIHDAALNKALQAITSDASCSKLAKVAVWHHPLNSRADDRIHDHAFAARLTKFGVRLGFHGHVHEVDLNRFHYEHDISGRHMELIATGTFGAPTVELPTGTPWSYNLLHVEDAVMTVHARSRRAVNAPWNEFPVWRLGPKGRPSSTYKVNIGRRDRLPPLVTRQDLLDHMEAQGLELAGYSLAVEANIFDQEGRLLLQKRGPAARDEIGKYEGVGGEVRNEENLPAVLQRLIASEIGDGVNVANDGLLEVRPVTFLDRHGAPQDWIVVSYLCRLVSGTPMVVDASHTSELRWFTLDELYRLPDNTLSRSTMRALALYRLRYQSRPYFASSGH